MRRLYFIPLLIVCCLAPRAMAEKIVDITRLDGQRTNTLTGLGLVIGLKGTGDGGDYSAAIKPLATMLAAFQDKTDVKQLTATKNVAVVMITATLPRDGVRRGDKVDVYLSSIGAATSLKGGRLFVTPLQPAAPMQHPPILGLAEGDVVTEDPSSPLVGTIKLGATMDADLPTQTISNNQFTLIIDNPWAGWPMAYAIAKIINEESDSGDTLATAVDSKNIVVNIPASERQHPDSFMTRVLRLPVPSLSGEARVVINEKTGTIIMSDDVEISPGVISQKGLTITTVTPTAPPTIRNPQIDTKDTIAIDTTKSGSGRLQDLVTAMEAMKVPVEDRITIIKELYDMGKLHAKLYINGVNQ